MTKPANDDATTTPQDRGQKGFRMLLALACLIVVLAGMKAAAGFLVPIAFAFFLSILSYPLTRWLVRLHLPRTLALGLTIALNIAVVAGLIYSAISLIGSFQQELPRYLSAVERQINQAAAWMQEQGVEGAVATAQRMFDWGGLIRYLTQQDVMTAIGSMLGSTFGTVAAVFASMVIVFITMIFILMEAHGTNQRILAVQLAGGPDLTTLLQSVTDIQKYLGIKTLISFLTGLLAGICCMLFGLKYPLLWAILAFVFNFVPAVGSSLASFPAIIEALVQNGWGSALGMALSYGLINFSLDNFVQPTLLGRRFGISSLVVILSVIFWGWLWGPVGMFLAVPLTMVIKVLLDNSEEFRWISVAMSKKKVVGHEVQLADYDLDMDDQEWIGGGASTESPGKK
jgi:predicted PurR-regulated permease PerM